MKKLFVIGVMAIMWLIFIGVLKIFVEYPFYTFLAICAILFIEGLFNKTSGFCHLIVFLIICGIISLVFLFIWGVGKIYIEYTKELLDIVLCCLLICIIWIWYLYEELKKRKK